MALKKQTQPENANELSLSRNVSAEYYNKLMRKRSRKRVLRVVLASLLVVLVCAGVAVASFVNDINQKITGSVDTKLQTVLTTQEPGKPFYLLLIGVDKDEGRTEDPEYGADDSQYRSDSIMLTRIDPGEKKVTMVSIHRDTLYDFGEHGQQKINAAYSIGQETYTTQVISEFAGVPISHYAEVDMDAMAAVIDSIGGIDVYVDIPIHDPGYTELDLEEGWHHLDGYDAAMYCRCRHAYDDLGDGDRYRARNQRQVISTVAKKVLTSDPATIANTVSTAASFVRTDLDVQTIVGLAMQFIGMDLENGFYMGMEPTTSKYVNNTWYEFCDVPAWRKMMSRVDQGLPPTEEGDADALETSEGDVNVDYVVTNNNGGDSDDTSYDYEPEPTYYDEPSYDDGYDDSDSSGGDYSDDSGGSSDEE